MELIGVVLSCPNWFDEAERMLDWGFENYHLEAPLSAGEVACEAAVEGGMAGTVTAVAESGLAAAVGEGRDVARGVRFPRRRARAPRKGRGHRHGDAVYRRNACGAKRRCWPGEDVERRDLWSALKRLLQRWALLFAT